MVYKKILLEGDAAVLAGLVPLSVSFGSALVGSASTAARQDHKHGAVGVLVGQIAAVNGAAAVVGTTLGFAHGDHKHPIGTFVKNVEFGMFQAVAMKLEILGSVPTHGTARVYFNTVDGHPYINV